MLKPRIIPCLDIKDGRVVKGVQFVDLIDAGDPVEQAKVYNDQGADELCFLDITASHENRGTIYDVVQKTAEQCFIPLTVGGGVRSADDANKLLRAGADKVSFNSAAIQNPDIINRSAEKFGSQCIVVAIDVREEDNGDYIIYTHGGRRATAINAISWAEEVANRGAGELLITSMNHDGVKQGFACELIKKIRSKINIPIVASGGMGKPEHAIAAIASGASAVLAASVFHFNEFTVGDVQRAIAHL